MNPYKLLISTIVTGHKTGKIGPKGGLKNLLMKKRERETLDQFFNYLNMKPYTSILGVFCSLRYHICNLRTGLRVFGAYQLKVRNHIATTGRRPRVPPCDEDDDDVEDDDEDDEKNVFANERTLRRDMGELKRKEE